MVSIGFDVEEYKVGDNVFFRPKMEKQGTYADEIVVPANIFARILFLRLKRCYLQFS